MAAYYFPITCGLSWRINPSLWTNKTKSTFNQTYAICNWQQVGPISLFGISVYFSLSFLIFVLWPCSFGITFGPSYSGIEFEAIRSDLRKESIDFGVRVLVGCASNDCFSSHSHLHTRFRKHRSFQQRSRNQIYSSAKYIAHIYNWTRCYKPPIYITMFHTEKEMRVAGQITR